MGFISQKYLIKAKTKQRQAVNAMVDVSGFTPAKAEAIALTAQDLSSEVGKLKKLKTSIQPENGEPFYHRIR